jgi:hypothetical protein
MKGARQQKAASPAGSGAALSFETPAFGGLFKKCSLWPLASLASASRDEGREKSRARDYIFSTAGITSRTNSFSERIAVSNGMLPRKR